MFKHSTYLELQHVMSSIVYRLIIMFYGGFIVMTYQNIVEAPYYAILILVYVALYFKLIDEKWKYARLILDLSVVMAVLYGKTPLDAVCFVYALFPLISAITHSGSHSRYWPVLMFTALLLVILDRGVDYGHLTIVVFVWLAGIQSWYSHQTNHFLNLITSHIDNYFADNDGTRKPHEIYKSIIDEINANLGVDYLTNIFSYTVKENDELWLVNSSKFMWDRTLKRSPKFMSSLKERKYIYRKGESSKYFYVEQRGVSYVYKCDLNPAYENLSLRKGYVINCVLKLAFGKISTLLASEYRISEARRKVFEETKGHIDYVTRALKVMHFVRNKLSPVKTVVTFYSSMDSMDADKVKRMEERVKKEVRQANTDLNEIIKTANYLLDKENNPYGGADVEKKNIKFLFVLLSEIVEYHLGGIVMVSDDIKNIEQRKEVNVSTTQLKLLFTDIVSNIEKYKKIEYKVTMGTEDDMLIVRFENDFDSKQESKCNDLVRDINNKNNDSIVLRKSHGVYNIKAAASVMGVEMKAAIEGEKKNKKYVLITMFKMYGDNDKN